jgi:hypothetical protein
LPNHYFFFPSEQPKSDEAKNSLPPLENIHHYCQQNTEKIVCFIAATRIESLEVNLADEY